MKGRTSRGSDDRTPFVGPENTAGKTCNPCRPRSGRADRKTHSSSPPASSLLNINCLCLCGQRKGPQSTFCLACDQSFRRARSEVRQNYIAVLRCKGHNLKEIASRLGMSPKTVEFHWSVLARRVGSTDPMRVLVFALNRGWVEFTYNSAPYRARTDGLYRASCASNHGRRTRARPYSPSAG